MKGTQGCRCQEELWKNVTPACTPWLSWLSQLWLALRSALKEWEGDSEAASLPRLPSCAKVDGSLWRH